ncbi:hypothetical protein GCM10010937_21820 [Gluconobacter japonicus]|uniref:Uncharacterized protein n=1 Tax=Gluconobacter japonicus TaxID=376620 RepID=A0ABQ5WKW6_GLUJA|nr:hypothetical protein AA3271_2407 [Gluconobacter japonicus NBRC 3271]GLQ60379.1 hypothetical protein GCM10010937_21820 [Gluconobacter japonicus]
MEMPGPEADMYLCGEWATLSVLPFSPHDLRKWNSIFRSADTLNECLEPVANWGGSFEAEA